MTIAEAHAARDAYIRDEANREQRRKNVTVAEYAAAWLPAHKAGVHARTYKDYERIVNTLIADLGDLPMKDVTTTDIIRVYAGHYVGRSESLIHKARMLFTAIWDTALEDRIIIQNPCRERQPNPGRAAPEPTGP